MRFKILVITVFLVFLAVIPGMCGIYLYVDPEGVYHFADRQKTPEYRPVGSVPRLVRHRTGRRHRFDGLIKRISAENGIRAELIRAVIRVESDFNPRAVSKAGAIGLMQLMPVHFRRYGISDPYDPAQNIAAGARYLKQLLERYDGDLVLSLSAYNAGPTAVDKYERIPPYGETRRFVDRVLSHYYRYCFGGNSR